MAARSAGGREADTGEGANHGESPQTFVLKRSLQTRSASCADSLVYTCVIVKRPWAVTLRAGLCPN